MANFLQNSFLSRRKCLGDLGSNTRSQSHRCRRDHLLIAFNDILFIQPSDDPVFPAHNVKRSPLGVLAYGSDRNISAVACAEQHQYCNPTIGSGDLPRCTNLTGAQLLWPHDDVPAIQLIRDTGLSTLKNDTLGLNSFQALLAGYSSAATSAGMYFAVFSRGAAALRGMFIALFQHPPAHAHLA
jgi:hypothetical protein